MMVHLRTRLLRVAPLAALVAAGGCFATRSDVRIVQSDVASLRTELLRNDAELREQLAQAVRLLNAANDSVRAISTRTVGLQGDVRGETRAIREQLLAVQQLLGQSQATINRLRAELEQRNTMAPPVQPPSGTPPAGNPPAGGAPPTTVRDSAVSQIQTIGPATLYDNALSQFRRGSWATARQLFQELLTTHPNSEFAPDASYHIAVSYQNEKNLSAADIAFGAVVTAYPDSPRAPTALYKRAQLAAQQGDTTRAREFANEVVKRYPRSDEAELVPDFLRNLR